MRDASVRAVQKSRKMLQEVQTFILKSKFVRLPSEYYGNAAKQALETATRCLSKWKENLSPLVFIMLNLIARKPMSFDCVITECPALLLVLKQQIVTIDPFKSIREKEWKLMVGGKEQEKFVFLDCDSLRRVISDSINGCIGISIPVGIIYPLKGTLDYQIKEIVDSNTNNTKADTDAQVDILEDNPDPTNVDVDCVELEPDGNVTLKRQLKGAENRWKDDRERGKYIMLRLLGAPVVLAKTETVKKSCYFESLEKLQSEFGVSRLITKSAGNYVTGGINISAHELLVHTKKFSEVRYEDSFIRKYVKFLLDFQRSAVVNAIWNDPSFQEDERALIDIVDDQQSFNDLLNRAGKEGDKVLEFYIRAMVKGVCNSKKWIKASAAASYNPLSCPKELLLPLSRVFKSNTEGGVDCGSIPKYALYFTFLDQEILERNRIKPFVLLVCDAGIVDTFSVSAFIIDDDVDTGSSVVPSVNTVQLEESNCNRLASSVHMKEVYQGLVSQGVYKENFRTDNVRKRTEKRRLLNNYVKNDVTDHTEDLLGFGMNNIRELAEESHLQQRRIRRRAKQNAVTFYEKLFVYIKKVVIEDLGWFEDVDSTAVVPYVVVCADFLGPGCKLLFRFL